MKTLATMILGGALSIGVAFGEAIPNNDQAKKAAPQLPFRPYQKRPVGTATSSRARSATLATPQLPFRPYQKRPNGSASKPAKVEASH